MSHFRTPLCHRDLWQAARSRPGIGDCSVPGRSNRGRVPRGGSSSLPTVALPLQAMLPDTDDLPFIEVAAAAGVPLVTGNIRHFPKRSRCGVDVLSPRQFLDGLRGQT